MLWYADVWSGTRGEALEQALAMAKESVWTKPLDVQRRRELALAKQALCDYHAASAAFLEAMEGTQEDPAMARTAASQRLESAAIRALPLPRVPGMPAVFCVLRLSLTPWFICPLSLGGGFQAGAFSPQDSVRALTLSQEHFEHVMRPTAFSAARVPKNGA